MSLVHHVSTWRRLMNPDQLSPPVKGSSFLLEIVTEWDTMIRKEFNTTSPLHLEVSGLHENLSRTRLQLNAYQCVSYLRGM